MPPPAGPDAQFAEFRIYTSTMWARLLASNRFDGYCCVGYIAVPPPKLPHRGGTGKAPSSEGAFFV